MKKTWIIIGIFMILTPLGILFTWDYGEAWGEWGEVELPNGQKWVPQQYSGGAPLPDYNIPGWENKLMASIGYWISAMIGVSMCFLTTLGVAKAVEIWKGKKLNE